MTFPGYGVGLAIALALVYSSAAAASQPAPAGADSAKKLFQAGKFPETAEVYSQILAHNSQDYSAIVRLGRIALLSNRLTDAQKWFQKDLALQPGDTNTKVMLAEAFYRGDDFEKAAETLDGIDVSTNQLIISQYPTLNTAKIASFKGQTPYELHGNGESTRLKFVKSDVLPVVTVRVNGGEEVTFLIDSIQENNVPGLYDGPFPWEELFGFHLAGMVGHDFFQRYSMTFDFEKMRIVCSGP